MEIKEIRIENLNLLLETYSRKQLASEMGYQDTNYLNQLCGGHGSFGSATARKIERCADLTKGWMDVRHTNDSPHEELAAIMKTLPPEEVEFLINFAKSRSKKAENKPA